MNKRPVCYLILPMLLLWGAAVVPSATAQKSTTPAATGTIYYARVASSWTQIMGMRADGSGKQSISLAQAATDTDYQSLSPSNCVHGSDPIRHRWWVFPKITGTYDEWRDPSGQVFYNWPHYDLFAARPNSSGAPEIIQLTDLYGIVNFQGEACWSNDSNSGPDSCIYCSAYDLRGHVSIVGGGEEEVRTIVDASQLGVGNTARVPITSTDIHQGWLAGTFAPLGPTSEPEDLDMILDLMLWPLVHGMVYGMDAPGGQEIVSNRKVSSQIGGAIKVLDPYAPDWDNPLRVLWPLGYGLPQWSPDGSTVAIFTGWQSPTSGTVRTVPASGATSPITLLNRVTTSVKQGRKTVSSTTSYGVGRWSHESRYLVVARETNVNGKVTRGIIRVPAGGGTVVNLNDDSTSYSVRPIRWVSNTLAP